MFKFQIQPGLTIEEVEKELEGTKLTYSTEEKYDVTVEAGKVISQKPEYKANYTIKENSKLELVVSLGQKMVKVPKVTGLEETAAKEALEAEDLEVKIEAEYNKKVEKGYVIGQDVEANTEVAAGTIVTIKVSQGVEETTVPNVLGKSKDDGTKELTDAGLTISAVLTEEDKTKNDGTILKQSLNPGDTV